MAEQHDVRRRYDAFISYSRKDGAFAEELEKQLEHFLLPRVKGEGKRHFEIFRDTEDLVGADYYAAIDAALKDSAKLVVLCSPRSAQSEFVGDEIRRFVEQRSAQDVIPVLIDGIPNNEAGQGQEDQCAFPAALCDALAMPLAIPFRDVRPGKDKLHKGEHEGSWYSLLAGILGIARTDLEQRQRKREARRRKITVAIATVIILVLSAATVYSFWQKVIAVEEKERALRGQSLFLADLAGQESSANRLVNGALLALEALPASMAEPDRPYVAVAESALYEALPGLVEHVVLAGHQDRVTFGTFSPRGKWVVTTSYDGSARLWDATTGAPGPVLQGHRRRVPHAAFSRDGRQLVTAGYDKVAILWDVEAGVEVRRFPSNTGQGFADSFYHASFAPDGRRVALASSGMNTTLWDADSGAMIAQPSTRGFNAHARFSPDGTRLVTTDRFEEGIAQILDGVTGQRLVDLVGHGAGHYYATFSSDSGRVLTASADRTARIWNARSGEIERVLRGHTGKVFHAEFSPDDSLVATASRDGTGRIWSATSGGTIAILSGHAGEVRHIAFDPAGGRVVTSSRDHTAMVWDVRDGSLLATLTGHTDDVTHAEFSADGTRVVSTGGSTARVWNLAAPLDRLTLSGALEPVTAAAFSPAGDLAATGSGILTSVDQTSRDPTIRLWDTRSGAELARMQGHSEGVRWLQFTPDGRTIVSLSWDKSVRIWDVDSHRLLRVLTGEFVAAALGPHGTLIATGDTPGTVSLWDVASGDRIAELPGHSGFIDDLAFSADGGLLGSASGDNTARIWDVAGRSLVSTLQGHTDSVRSIRFSPDGSVVATAGGHKTYYKESKDNMVRLWDPRSGAELHRLTGHAEQINHLSFSPDGRLLASSSGRDAGDGAQGTMSLDNSTILWDPKTGEEVRRLTGHAGPVVTAAFTPDGRRLITGSQDRSARLWNVETGANLAVFRHRSRINRALFDRSGLLLLTASGYEYDDAGDYTARLWRLQPDTDALVAHARARLGGVELTPKQRRKFFLEQ